MRIYNLSFAMSVCYIIMGINNDTKKDKPIKDFLSIACNIIYIFLKLIYIYNLNLYIISCIFYPFSNHYSDNNNLVIQA